MGFLDFLKTAGAGADINEAVAAYRAQDGAWLVDVREADEYGAGHIPGSVNLPLSTLAEAALPFPDRDARLYVYCLTGARSGRAVRLLRSLGYTDVRNIGGVNAYRGPLEY